MGEPKTVIQAAKKVNRRAKRNGLGLAELLIVLAACLVPLFLFAKQISGDEWIKASVTGGVAAVIYVYKLWLGREPEGD